MVNLSKYLINPVYIGLSWSMLVIFAGCSNFLWIFILIKGQTSQSHSRSRQSSLASGNKVEEEEGRLCLLMAWCMVCDKHAKEELVHSFDDSQTTTTTVALWCQPRGSYDWARPWSSKGALWSQRPHSSTSTLHIFSPFSENLGLFGIWGTSRCIYELMIDDQSF